MQQQLAVTGLTPKDIQTLCRAAQVQPPEDPALNLEQHLALHSLTVQDLWAKLSGSTDVHVMVACAVLRGAVQHCPPDPRLNPAPLPKLGHKPKSDAPKPQRTRRAPAEDTPAQPVVRPWQRPDAVVVAFKPNPRRAGSAAHTRYAQYAVGRTCLELLGLGLRRRDFARDVRRGWLEFGLPEGAPAEAPAWPAGVAGEDEGGDE